MEIKIDYHNPKPVYQQIKEQIKYAVASGSLKPGDKLPPIRSLAKDLGVNPGTIQRVYRELLFEGYLITKGSGGTYISENAPQRLKRERETLIQKDISICTDKAKKLGIELHELINLISKEWKKHD